MSLDGPNEDDKEIDQLRTFIAEKRHGREPITFEGKKWRQVNSTINWVKEPSRSWVSLGSSSSRERMFFDQESELITELKAKAKEKCQGETDIGKILANVNELINSLTDVEGKSREQVEQELDGNLEAFLSKQKRNDKGDIDLDYDTLAKQKPPVLVCRHKAILAASILASLVKEGVLPEGSVRQYRSNLVMDGGKVDGAHTWSVFRDAKSGDLWLCDPRWQTAKKVEPPEFKGLMQYGGPTLRDMVKRTYELDKESLTQEVRQQQESKVYRDQHLLRNIEPLEKIMKSVVPPQKQNDVRKIKGTMTFPGVQLRLEMARYDRFVYAAMKSSLEKMGIYCQEGSKSGNPFLVVPSSETNDTIIAQIKPEEFKRLYDSELNRHIQESELADKARQAAQNPQKIAVTPVVQVTNPLPPVDKPPVGPVPTPAKIMSIKRKDRIKQKLGERKKTKDASVVIAAPEWVQKALLDLTAKLEGATFEIEGVKTTINKDNPLTLQLLSAIARNETANVTGEINFDLYPGIDKATVIAIRDLVKHSVIVGNDKIIATGGYPKGKPIIPLTKPTDVYVCDLPGMQFQNSDNTGRHVLIPLTGELSHGLLDESIFTHTVGEKKATKEEAQKDKKRYIQATFGGKEVLFDTKAYQAFTANDFLLAATTLNSQAKTKNDLINFKFLKYGAGFFAEGLDGEAKQKLGDNLTLGVEQGLKKLLALPESERSQIKRIELPFFQAPPPPVSQVSLDSLKRMEQLCAKHGIEFSSSAEDALKQTSTKYITATTNCSDPHAPTGNEMEYGSVDAAIAENVEGHLDHFNAALNTQMKAQFKPIYPTLSTIPTIVTPPVKLPPTPDKPVGLGGFTHVLDDKKGKVEAKVHAQEPVPPQHGMHLFSVGQRPLTPRADAVKHARGEVAIDPNATFKDVAAKVQNYTQDKKDELGIKSIDASQVESQISKLTVEMYCNDAKKDTKKMYIEPASTEGGVKYSMEKSQDAAENQRILLQTIKIAVDNAQPGDILKVPQHAENKEEIATALDKVMKEKFKDKYTPGIYKIPGEPKPAERISSPGSSKR